MVLRIIIRVEFKPYNKGLIEKHAAAKCNGVMVGTTRLRVQQPVATS